jgi:hypothetical protein
LVPSTGCVRFVYHQLPGGWLVDFCGDHQKKRTTANASARETNYVGDMLVCISSSFIVGPVVDESSLGSAHTIF